MANREVGNCPFGPAQMFAKRYLASHETWQRSSERPRSDTYKRAAVARDCWTQAIAAEIDMQPWDLSVEIIRSLSTGVYWS